MSTILIVSACNKSEEILPEVYLKDVVAPEILINGDWEVSTKLSDEFWKTPDTLNWSDVKVPGELMMQGIAIKSDEPFLYRKKARVPEDYAQKRIYLQFDGVYSYARLWVNGEYIRDHYGGFTRWKAEITDYVKPGEEALILLEVTDRADNISYASGYAKHQIGGVLRDVKLLARPENPLEQLVVETDLDSSFTDAVLKVSGKLLNEAKETKVQISLKSPEGKSIHLKEPLISLNGKNLFEIENRISKLTKWDAEHPNLYKLRLSFIKDDEIIWSQSKDVGFREVQVEGNKLIVNGEPVKLRGANRHDVHPTLGRVSTPEYELKDVLLAKEANMNYIRTSHYPPTENFLELCDKYGLYVEDETAVCFVIPGYRIEGYEIAANSHNNPKYTNRYLSQIEEMVTANRNHPSVVIWSIGNESIYGSNFKKSYDWIQDNDSTRPIMFSYPGSVSDSLKKPYQILSMHYPPINGNLTQYEIQTKNFGYKKMLSYF
ncbi:hypothetical protein LZ575_09515 [Antarcticibacterium sp. 1MA-6-2]|uniref:glycoside hydrolase family 2 protein n=1 Tax=Antarcticibacterium sp. 1MA-6-2 TaxID=2908210 RepID=UPI001F3B141A|nr:glycoside hydrolase family 2 TIM barrel-domain containing protein [Antarcticibacterium sp. 1MA-6-2]UJH92674.1 hypothetical protein LZ575_09515 [Antarcticibacterium sp. 1MA-6-2]